MKRLFISICLVLIASVAWSDGFIMPITAGGACSSPSDNLFDEGFEGTGYEGTWNESATGPNEDGSRPGSQSPTALCSESLIVSTSTTTAMWSETNEGTARDTAYIRFYLYITTTVADNGVFIAAGGPNANIVSTVSYSWAVELNTWGGPYIIARGAANSSSISITANAWHYIDIYFVRNSATSWIKVDGGSAQNFTPYDNASQYYALGHLFNIPGSAMTTNFDLFAVNSSEIGSE